MARLRTPSSSPRSPLRRISPVHRRALPPRKRSPSAGGRLGRFLRNAGAWNALCLGLACVFLVLAIRRHAQEGTFVWTLPALIGGVSIAWLLKEAMIRNLAAAARMLNAVLFLAGILAAVPDRLAQMPPSVSAALFGAFFGFYVTAFFLLHSDPRVERAG